MRKMLNRLYWGAFYGIKSNRGKWAFCGALALLIMPRNFARLVLQVRLRPLERIANAFEVNALQFNAAVRLRIGGSEHQWTA